MMKPSEATIFLALMENFIHSLIESAIADQKQEPDVSNSYDKVAAEYKQKMFRLLTGAQQ